MADIFISYRRADTAGHARALHRDLCLRFAPERIFFDWESIESGEKFHERIRVAVNECQVLLALIGPGWRDAHDSSGNRRLDDPQDVVRGEIALALRLGKTVIPVLFDDTPVPELDELSNLKPLSGRNALTLRGKTYEYDVQLKELVRLLAQVPGMPAPVDVAGETERHAPGVSARGSGAVTAGAGGVAVGGDLAGTVIVGDNNQVNVHHMTQSGGIRARRITAHNVVDGFQAIGADDTLVARAIRLSAEIQSGGITADEIIAQNLVSGLQFITGPQTATPANLKKEVAALKASLAAALGAGDLPNDAAAQAAMAHLGAAEAELAKDQPSGWQVAGSLKQAAGILKTTADTLTAADTVGNKVIALLPWAAALWAMAKRLLAG